MRLAVLVEVRAELRGPGRGGRGPGRPVAGGRSAHPRASRRLRAPVPGARHPDLGRGAPTLRALPRRRDRPGEGGAPDPGARDVAHRQSAWPAGRWASSTMPRPTSASRFASTPSCRCRSRSRCPGRSCARSGSIAGTSTPRGRRSRSIWSATKGVVSSFRFLQAARARLYLALGEPDEALRELSELGDRRVGELGTRAELAPHWPPLAVRALLAAERARRSPEPGREGREHGPSLRRAGGDERGAGRARVVPGRSRSGDRLAGGGGRRGAAIGVSGGADGGAGRAGRRQAPSGTPRGGARAAARRDRPRRPHRRRRLRRPGAGRAARHRRPAPAPAPQRTRVADRERAPRREPGRGGAHATGRSPRSCSSR